MMPTPGIDERRDMALLALGEPALGVEREIARPVDADRPRGGGDQQHGVHRSGSKAAASRAKLERGPSIQNASVLQRKKGAAPRNGSAFLIPPPWSSSFARSSEMMIPGARRAARCASI